MTADKMGSQQAEELAKTLSQMKLILQGTQGMIFRSVSPSMFGRLLEG